MCKALRKDGGGLWGEKTIKSFQQTVGDDLQDVCLFLQGFVVQLMFLNQYGKDIGLDPNIFVFIGLCTGADFLHVLQFFHAICPALLEPQDSFIRGGVGGGRG